MLEDDNDLSRKLKRLRRGASSEEKVEKETEQKKKNEYCGYKLSNSDSSSDAIETLQDEISASQFFDRYVSTRKPVILNFFPSFPMEETATKAARTEDGNNMGLSSRWIVNESVLQSVAGLELVQVEKRGHVGESFGQPRTKSRQLLMNLKDFLDCLRTGTSNDTHDPELYYLSPQQQPQKQHQEEDDPETSPFQTPCWQLVQNQNIPSTLPIAGNMVLHSCNLVRDKHSTTEFSIRTITRHFSFLHFYLSFEFLESWLSMHQKKKWMGTSKEGSSSGLHHDYHDNFYVLMNGTKRFKLYSPDTAQYMHTRGIIDTVYSNGLISYVGSESRSDGVPLVLCGTASEEITSAYNPWCDEQNNREQEQNSSPDVSNEESSHDEENEEEVVIGSGFDYHCSDEEEGEHMDAYEWDKDIHDDYDESEEQDDCFAVADNFSIIPLSALQNKDRLIQDFPEVASLPTCTIELQSGQCLYLPAGWFHEVVSFSSGDREGSVSATHLAVNYWYFPPNSLTNFTNPYQDDFHQKIRKM